MHSAKRRSFFCFASDGLLGSGGIANSRRRGGALASVAVAREADLANSPVRGFASWWSLCAAKRVNSALSVRRAVCGSGVNAGRSIAPYWKAYRVNPAAVSVGGGYAVQNWAG